MVFELGDGVLLLISLLWITELANVLVTGLRSQTVHGICNLLNDELFMRTFAPRKKAATWQTATTFNMHCMKILRMMLRRKALACSTASWPTYMNETLCYMIHRHFYAEELRMR